MEYKLADIFEKPISGEWGKELEEGKKVPKLLGQLIFTNLGKLDFNNMAERNIDLKNIKNKNIKKQEI